MSFLKKVFGAKEPEAPTASEAIRKLRDTEDLLTKKQEFIEKKIENELVIIKKNGRTNKRAAIEALKRKKRHEKQLQQIDGTLATIEMQREALEGAHTNTEVLKSMKFAADALKTTHKKLDIDDVHGMMDDIAEQQDLAKEITEAISNPVALGDNFDMDELEKELEELEQEELDKELLATGTGPSLDLPEVPRAERAPKQPQPDLEDELKELAGWAS